MSAGRLSHSVPTLARTGPLGGPIPSFRGGRDRGAGCCPEIGGDENGDRPHWGRGRSAYERANGWTDRIGEPGTIPLVIGKGTSPRVPPKDTHAPSAGRPAAQRIFDSGGTKQLIRVSDRGGRRAEGRVGHPEPEGLRALAGSSLQNGRHPKSRSFEHGGEYFGGPSSVDAHATPQIGRRGAGPPPRRG